MKNAWENCAKQSCGVCLVDNRHEPGGVVLNMYLSANDTFRSSKLWADCGSSLCSVVFDTPKNRPVTLTTYHRMPISSKWPILSLTALSSSTNSFAPCCAWDYQLDTPLQVKTYELRDVKVFTYSPTTLWRVSTLSDAVHAWTDTQRIGDNNLSPTLIRNVNHFRLTRMWRTITGSGRHHK